MRVVVMVLAGLWSAHALLSTCLEAQQPARAAGDSAFLLATDDPSRSPSPFVGNGRLGVVIPPLGIGGSSSFMAGLYEHGPEDVPRIVAIPAWNAIDIFDGERWLAPTQGAGSVRTYRQSLDMRTATASTGYDWI